MSKCSSRTAREVTACDVMTTKKSIETRSLCLMAAHIVGSAYLVFESAEGAAT